MANYIAKHLWHQQGLEPIDEKIYYNRRAIIRQLGLSTGSVIMSSVFLSSCQSGTSKRESKIPEIQAEKVSDNSFNFSGMHDLYPANRNNRFTIERPLTDEYEATHKNNFYEFISREDPNIYNVHKFVSEFDNRDWQIEVSGLVENPGIYTLESLIKKFGLEERVYRFRCVERWSMAVPWTGFPLASLIKSLHPQNNCKFVRMYSYANPDQMEGVRNLTHYPWPYFEGLRIDEAMNELSFLATGLYGKPIPKQNGAPVRLVVPWKYGYKNIKSIVKMEFVNTQPETFWHTIAPSEYPFISNVDPEVPHPRWSQAFEQMIPDGEKIPTLPFNGYGDLVAHMY